jgi:hypothetical protein
MLWNVVKVIGGGGDFVHLHERKIKEGMYCKTVEYLVLFVETPRKFITAILLMQFY